MPQLDTQENISHNYILKDNELTTHTLKMAIEVAERAWDNRKLLIYFYTSLSPANGKIKNTTETQ